VGISLFPPLRVCVSLPKKRDRQKEKRHAGGRIEGDEHMLGEELKTLNHQVDCIHTYSHQSADQQLASLYPLQNRRKGRGSETNPAENEKPAPYMVSMPCTRTSLPSTEAKQRKPFSFSDLAKRENKGKHRQALVRI